VTGRKQPQRARKATAGNEPAAEETDPFRVLVETVKDYAIFMLDRDGRVRSWNLGAQIIKGYAPSEIIGRPISLFYTPEDRQSDLPRRLLEQAAHAGRVEDEGWRVRKDGTRFWADVIITALYDPAGELSGFAKVTRDLTERLRLDDERDHRVRAEEAVRLRDEFLSIASHELRTPLTALQIELHGWQKRVGDDDPREVRRVSRAVRSADRLGALIESLLDVSRIATGRLALTPERLEISEAVSQAVDSLRPVAAKAGCETSFTTTGPVWAWADRLRLDQVVMNLLSNAFKYGAGAPVNVSVSNDAGFAILEITDHGPGIPDKDLARIFGRFERAASLRHYGGLGLGLYVSREIVESQGGRISAENRPGGGACFTVRLPVQPRAADEIPC
jgi:PAS domain S-box-containing protein